MANADLLDLLRGLETALHSPRVRASSAELGTLLHPAFREFGRSGKTYDFEEIISAVASASVQPTVLAQDFELALICDNVALLTYRSAHVDIDGKLQSHANRSSLWEKTDSGWKMRFHQGTPTRAFEKSMP